MISIDQLLSRHKLVSDQVSVTEIAIILHQLKSVMDREVPGAIVEFGCYNGTTSLFIQRLLQAYSTQQTYHVYDSFAGLPDKSAQDQSPAGEQFKLGELSVSKSDFIHNFKQAHLPLPVIHKAWFNQLNYNDIPSGIAFAFLDGDYYESIRTSLKLIEDKLSPGAIIIVDDYQSEALPGAAKAVDEWLFNHKNMKLRVEKSLAIIGDGRGGY